MRAKLRQSFKENLSYKLVALFVALVLWLTMLGRQNTVVSRELELQFLLPQNTVLSQPVETSVRVEVSGPRTALKKFSELNSAFEVDLRDLPSGTNLVYLQGGALNLPLSVRVISLEPETITVEIVEEVRKTQ